MLLKASKWWEAGKYISSHKVRSVDLNFFLLKKIIYLHLFVARSCGILLWLSTLTQEKICLLVVTFAIFLLFLGYGLKDY
jgi:hypothetical protein